MIALNASVANQLIKFKNDVDLLINKGRKKDEAIFQVLKKYIVDSEKIRFEGDGYSEEWKKEAEKRGLTNIISVPESLTKYLTDTAKEVLIGNRGNTILPDELTGVLIDVLGNFMVSIH